MLIHTVFMYYMVHLEVVKANPNGEIDALLNALHNMFGESPPKREDDTKVTGNDIFPLPFYSCRSLEDKSVAERALQIWSKITATSARPRRSQRVKFLHEKHFPQ